LLLLLDDYCREVLRRLFAETLKLKSSEKLTLAEMLNETASDASSRTPLKCNQQSNTEEVNFLTVTYYVWHFLLHANYSWLFY